MLKKLPHPQPPPKRFAQTPRLQPTANYHMSGSGEDSSDEENESLSHFFLSNPRSRISFVRFYCYLSFCQNNLHFGQFVMRVLPITHETRNLMHYYLYK